MCSESGVGITDDLHSGDTIYMDDRPFIVDGVRFYDVTFRDPTMTYPIFRAESKTYPPRVQLTLLLVQLTLLIKKFTLLGGKPPSNN